MRNASRTAAAAARARSRPAPVDTPTLVAVGLCLLFFCEGLLFIPYAGLQNDELLFAEALFPPLASYGIHIGHFEIRTMLMAYVGTLKAWLYTPIFAIFAPSAWSVRLPVLLLGALTVGLFCLLVRRICGVRAALAATALLATDAGFVLTSCWDWGPVVLQHLLLVVGLLLLVEFHARPRWLPLAAGFFAFGLAMWDKALFSWSLAGLVVAAAIVLPATVARHFSARNLTIAVTAFLLGAAPLVMFNLTHRFATFRDTASFTTERLSQKVTMLRYSLDGGGLLGYVSRDDLPLQPTKPANALEEVSVALSDSLDQPRAGFLLPAFLISFALLPWLWHTPARKPMLFSLVFLAVTWVQMAFTKNAGGGAHHTVLLWPFPHLFIGAALAQGSLVLRRFATPVLAVLVAAIGLSNIAVLNQNLAQLIERGTTTIWTDAIDPLEQYLRRQPASNLYIMDWGMMNVLRAAGEGKLPLAMGSDPVMKDPVSPSDQSLALRMLADRQALWVGHTEGNEIIPGVSARFATLAQAAGYQKQTVQVISDRHGRPVFEVYRWKHAG